jgi:hypothetical protein
MHRVDPVGFPLHDNFCLEVERKARAAGSPVGLEPAILDGSINSLNRNFGAFNAPSIHMHLRNRNVAKWLEQGWQWHASSIDTIGFFHVFDRLIGAGYGNAAAWVS